ncbi:MAG: TIGR04290 family methyltransferase, partial [Bradymonadaceae bacterium]
QRDRMRQPGWPTLAFVEGELAGDPTNWWVPNPACCRALLRHTGFAIQAELDDEIYVCRRRSDRRPSAERYGEEFRAATGADNA